jgi:hypothetical protein
MKGSNKAKVGVVAAACLMGLIIVLKNVLLVPVEVLSRDMIIYIIVYFGFITAMNFTEETPGGPAPSGRGSDNPWMWGALVVVVTLAIIAVYAFL